MLTKFQHVHFIGIGGIGVSAAAKWCALNGKTVTGSDVRRSPNTDALAALGATVYEGHAAAQLADTVDLVVYSPAVQESNPERFLARERGVPQWSYPDFLGAMSRQYSTIAVSGTNGKSTTTAMLGLILEAAGYDPTVIVGSLVPSFPYGNLRTGGGRFFVVEACEYRANMLRLEPEMIVLTNVEEDHLDFYRDIDHIRETFQTFADKLKGRGLAVWNKNDPESGKIRFDNGVSYGYETDAAYVGRNRCAGVGFQTIETDHGTIRLLIPGAFNAMNALAALAAAMELGVPFETCQRVLAAFPGIWRRFERVGKWRGADVVSDYGHHPTAIRGTIEAAREFFPGRRVVLCFQPHQHARTQELFNDFIEEISKADVVILPEIYEVEGRTEDISVSSKDLVEQIRVRVPGKDVRYANDLQDAEHILGSLIKEEDVLVVQGAGDVDELARKIASK